MNQEGETYYDILNLRPDASLQDITVAYRKLAKILHPDVCESPDADELFKVVNEAYQVLKDPKKKEAYDASLAVAENSLYGKYHQGRQRYRDPHTWYHSHQHHGSYRRPIHEEPVKPADSTIPRIVQVVLFYLTLLMAVLILAQLFLIPWINGVNSTDARNSLNEGNKWMQQEEFQKAIDSYRDAIAKLPTFYEAWRAKGIAELKKGDALTKLNQPGAEGYYRDAIRSFSKIPGRNPEDIAVTKAIAEAYLKLNDRSSAISVLNRAQESGYWDASMSDLLREANSQPGQQSPGPSV